MLIFIGIWLFIYVIYLVQPFEVDRIRGFTWLVLLTSNMSVIFGYYIPYHLHRFGKSFYSRQRTELLRFDNRKLMIIVVTIFLLSLIGNLAYIYLHSLEAGGLFEYFTRPWMARDITVMKAKEATVEWKYYESVFSFFINLNYIGALFGGIFFATSKKYRFLAFLPLLLGFSQSVSTFTRRFVMESTFIWMISAFYVSVFITKESRKRVLSALLKILVFMLSLIAVYFISIVTFRTHVLMKYYGQTGKIIEYIGQNLYSYMVGHIVMLDWYLMEDVDLYYGTSLLKNLFKWFNLIGIYDNPKTIPYMFWPYEFIRSKYIMMNTFTYIRIFYEDFGIGGLLVMSFLLGVAAYKLVVHYLKRFSLVKLFILSILCYNLFISFFDFYTRRLFVPIYCCILLLIIERKLRIFERLRINA